MRLSVLAVLIACAAPHAADAQQLLDPGNPGAVGKYIRADGQICPRTPEIRLEGQTNRGNLYRVTCPAGGGVTARSYQMILSPDRSHVSLYQCGPTGLCPIRIAR